MSKVREYRVEHIPYTKQIMNFLKIWHYSKYTNLQHKHTFGLYRDGRFGIPELIGVCVYTRPAGPSAAKSYCPETPDKVLELRRLCLIDDTPKNAESFFVGRTLRWLKKNTDWQMVISYADENQGHMGIIYKATNFDYLGKTSPSKTLEVDGRKMHIRTLTMLDRPYGVEINRRYKAGDPNIKIITCLPKHIYVYRLIKN